MSQPSCETRFYGVSMYPGFASALLNTESPKAPKAFFLPSFSRLKVKAIIT